MGDAAFDLSFSVELRFRPFALVAPAFVAVTAERAEPGMTLAESGPVAPYAAVEMRVSGPPGGGGQVVAGLSAPGDGDQVVVVYDAARGRVAIEVRVDGHRLQLRRKSVRLPGEFRLAFVLCENRVTALVADADTGDGQDAWRPVLSERARVAEALDLRDPATLANLAYAWGSRWPTRGPTRVTRPSRRRSPRSGPDCSAWSACATCTWCSMPTAVPTPAVGGRT